MQTGNPSIRPFHFGRGQLVQLVPPDPLDPSSIFAPIVGRVGQVECESTSMPGYFHVRFDRDGDGFPVNPLYLVPWAWLQLVEVAHVPG